MIAIDLFAGLGGWAEGFLAEGYECIGYDIEAHDYGTGGYPGILILRDVRSIHGSECKDAAVIVASPPCQGYSYRAMPWKRAKALPPPDNTLFNECFRIQREASEAAKRYIPLIVENVRGAQKWVGRARWHYGSFYLWGDVPALMPITLPLERMKSKISCAPRRFDERIASTPEEAHALHYRLPDSVKTVGHANIRDGYAHTRHLTNQRESDAARNAGGTKQGGDWFGANCESSMSRLYGSKSPKRKQAAAMIAKIPFPLSSYIARHFRDAAASDTHAKEVAA